MTEVKLTKTDRAILESYRSEVRCLAKYFSDSYEFVLHSLEDYDHSVIEIVNGEHTGRTIGAPITDLALNMLHEINDNKEDSIVYFSHNYKGEPLKSTTIAIRGEKDRIIGLLCINCYMNTPLVNVIESFLPTGSLVGTSMNEDFTQNPDELIKNSFEEVQKSVINDESIAVSNKNKVIVERLYDKGIFRLKDAVIKVAEMMDVSKNTVYMHIRNHKKDLT